jgi:hypothetical protein
MKRLFSGLLLLLVAGLSGGVPVACDGQVEGALAPDASPSAAPDASRPSAVPADTDGGDAAADAADGSALEAAACSAVVASDYDQSCVADSDCVQVGQVLRCPAGACDGCLSAGINKNALSRYLAAFASAVASIPDGETCGCPCEGDFAICRAGKCAASWCLPDIADTLPACADAGGMCSYTANTPCSRYGPPGSCAYADEICCVGP